MTVEAHHLNILPSQQRLLNRNMNTNSTDTNLMNIYNHSSENLIPTPTPSYNNLFLEDNRHQNITDSDSNSNSNIVSLYPRDWINNYHFASYKNSLNVHHQNTDTDIDNLISQQKFRVELEEKRKREIKMIIEAIEIEMTKKMKAKEQEIEKLERMNMILEERVKTLVMENQIWRELAQNNEATVNALRNNLEQILREMKNEGAAEQDGESCCENGWRTLVLCAQDKEDGESEKKRWCRNCGERVSCVLILPCRHLCLCDLCVATVHICPICQSFKNSTLNINLS
ncbi:probable BOI-related E3 ubiquitin-protein ligase 2 isoform X2 [Vicia villosa]|uniref:probable BOI-related E3 ubiquitin-protein ligase 2 isoform X2 n=1 Tax=Vicia villosa TaxID=3911 RepID=UPI00273B5F82|nr:probable BOI-related E3 ubiquitin-protein ligase 2 isoform X2 [Vicia villosa]